MKIYKLGILEGDGIGPEITKATKNLIDSVATKEKVTIEWRPLLMGHKGIIQADHPMPSSTVSALEKCDGWIMGPHDANSYPEKFKELRNPSGELRHVFDLFANVRPAKNIAGVSGVVSDADLVIYRENTEGYYPDRNMYSGNGEFAVTEDVVISTGVFTRKAIERIAHAAFKKAMQRRKMVTIVHKANVIKLGSGMFLQVCREVSKEYPDVVVNDFHIDAMCAHLVRNIKAFDVIVTENMFGDILSDLTGELIGSLGMAPSINANEQFAMAQAAHGSAPDIADKGIANPVGLMLSVGLLCEWLGEKNDDERMRNAGLEIDRVVRLTIEEGNKTKDIGGELDTKEFTKRVIQRIDKS